MSTKDLLRRVRKLLELRAEASTEPEPVAEATDEEWGVLAVLRHELRADDVKEPGAPVTDSEWAALVAKGLTA